MRYFFLLILLSEVTLLSAQNVMLIENAFARPGDTAIVSVAINNTDRFVSFQLDLELPDNVEFISNSLQLTGRSVNHLALGNMMGAHRLRVFSYSPDNTSFEGNTGSVLSFRLVPGSVRGELPLAVENGIIGDSLSTNIITGTGNGILSVFPLGMNDQTNSFSTGLKVFPNPFKDHSQLFFHLDQTSMIVLTLTDLSGKEKFRMVAGEYPAGRHTLALPDAFLNQVQPGETFILGVTSESTNRPSLKHFIKLTCIDY